MSASEYFSECNREAKRVGAGEFYGRSAAGPGFVTNVAGRISARVR